MEINEAQCKRLLHAYETLQLRLSLMHQSLSNAERAMHVLAWEDIRNILLGSDKGICDIHGGEWPGYDNMPASWEALK
jgi:hypothetical protein